MQHSHIVSTFAREGPGVWLCHMTGTGLPLWTSGGCLLARLMPPATSPSPAVLHVPVLTRCSRKSACSSPFRIIELLAAHGSSKKCEQLSELGAKGVQSNAWTLLPLPSGPWNVASLATQATTQHTPK